MSYAGHGPNEDLADAVEEPWSITDQKGPAPVKNESGSTFLPDDHPVYEKGWEYTQEERYNAVRCSTCGSIQRSTEFAYIGPEVSICHKCDLNHCSIFS